MQLRQSKHQPSCIKEQLLKSRALWFLWAAVQVMQLLIIIIDCRLLWWMETKMESNINFLHYSVWELISCCYLAYWLLLLLILSREHNAIVVRWFGGRVWIISAVVWSQRDCKLYFKRWWSASILCWILWWSVHLQCQQIVKFTSHGSIFSQ